MFCSGCERDVKRYHARSGEKGYCGTCYKNLFHRYECKECGKGFKVIEPVNTPICNSCVIKDRQCEGCQKPLPRATKIIDGKAYCWPCTRQRKALENCERCSTPSKSLSRAPKYGIYERVCNPCWRKAAGHASCSKCGKNRQLVGVSAVTGKPECKQCLEQPDFKCPKCQQTAKRHSKSQCVSCYWAALTKKKIDYGVQQLTSTWARHAYDGFGNWLVKTRNSHTAATKLKRYLPKLKQLEAAFSDPGLISTRWLVNQIGVDGIRRYSLLFDYLQASKTIPLYTDKELQRFAQISSSDKIGQRDAGLWFYDVLQSFVEHLIRIMEVTQDRSYRPMSGRTVLAASRAASEFLRFVDSKGRCRLVSQISQIDVDDFAYNFQGYHTSINTFLHYLNETGLLHEKLHLVNSTSGLKASGLFDLERLNSLLNIFCDTKTSSRDGCIGLLMLIFAQRASDIATLKKEQIKIVGDEVKIRLTKANLTMPDEYAAVFKRWLSERRKIESNNKSQWLFPGRQYSRPLSEATITTSIKKFGVSGRQLRSMAVFMLYVNGIEHPNAAHAAFGVSKAMSGFYHALYGGYLYEMSTNMKPTN